MFDPELIAFVVFIPIAWVLAMYAYAGAALMVVGAAYLLFVAFMTFFHVGSILAVILFILIQAINFFKPSETLNSCIPFLLCVFIVDFVITGFFGFDYIQKSEYISSLFDI